MEYGVKRASAFQDSVFLEHFQSYAQSCCFATAVDALLIAGRKGA